MSTMTNLLAFDGAATPVLHTLVPVSVTKEKDEIVAVYREAISTLPVYAQVSCVLKMKRMSSGVYRTHCRTEVPVMESIGSSNAAGYTAAPKVAYVDTNETNGYFHERGTIAGRRLAKQLHVNITNGITTTVTPVTTGPFAELFEQLTAPA